MGLLGAYVLSVGLVGCATGAEDRALPTRLQGSADGGADPAVPEHTTRPRARTVARSEPCYVVYLPGYNNDSDPATTGEAERRDYWRRNRRDTWGDFVKWSSAEDDPEDACTTLVAGYRAGVAFWEDAVAGSVTRQINDFITENSIPEGRLLLVGHSLGGVVLRWIVNNGEPGSLYYNYEGSDYARVVRHTRYVITLASPHLGSQAADAVYRQGDTFCGNFIGSIAGLFGYRTPATEALRRVSLEGASAQGGWMSDEGRTRAIYTVAGRRWDSGNGSREDYLLQSAWWCMGLSACSSCSNTPGDGVVTEASAAGIFERSGSDDERSWQEGQRLGGRRVDWLRVDHNHHHIRLDDQRLDAWDAREGQAMVLFPGSYLGQRGRNLEQ
ncbi:MAG: hypothetical protein HY909_24010 [Deltaproteobacteria bacterium]|nr:hypothetical protein [Deltaproteobacteria bacterium]